MYEHDARLGPVVGGWMAVLALLFVAAGCGSTVQRGAGAVGQGQGSPDPLGAPAAAGPAAELAGGGVTAGFEAPRPAASPGVGSAPVPQPGAPPAVASAPAAPPAALAGPPPATSPGAMAPAPAPAPPPPADPIDAGFVVFDNVDYSQFGVEGASSGDTRRTVEILVEDLNARGGVAGRAVNPVIHAVDYAATASQGADPAYEAACGDLVEDQQVAVALATARSTPNFRQCLADAHVPYIANGNHQADSDAFAAAPSYMLVDAPSLDRIAHEMVVGLADRGFYGSAPRIGLIHYDSPAHHQVVERSLQPALASRGLAISQTVAVTEPNSTTDLGTQSGQVSNAVLRFNTEGITHVIVLEEAGDITFGFANAAEAQGYRPAYAVNSLALLQGFQALNSPPAQMANLQAIGWWPVYDVVVDAQPEQPERARCLALMQAGGLTYTDAVAEGIALGYCAGVWFFEAAGTAAAGHVDEAAFIAGVESLGTSHPSPSVTATNFGPGRHDGASEYRFVVWDEACTCFVYDGPPRGF